MDNSNNRDVNPYVQRVDAPDGGADALRENYTQNYAGGGSNGLGCDNNPDMNDKEPHRMGLKKGFGAGIATGIAATLVLGGIVLFAYTMITGRSVHTVAKSADVLDDKTVQKIDELANYIDEYYYEDYDKDDLENGLLHGVMEGLNDPYSVYYNKKETKVLYESTGGEYDGVGAVMSQSYDTGVITITQVYKDSPAEKAGLKDNDILYKVNGKVNSLATTVQAMQEESQSDQIGRAHV